MRLKEFVRIDGNPDSVTITFRDDDGVECELKIQPDRPESILGLVQQLVWLLGKVAPEPGLAFGIKSGRPLESGVGVDLTTNEGLKLMVILDRADLSAFELFGNPKKNPSVH